jgi:hypothetical protein
MSSLTVPGTNGGSNNKVAKADGYTDNVFLGKQEQLAKVCSFIEEKGFIPKELVQNEVSWFYGYVLKKLLVVICPSFAIWLPSLHFIWIVMD